MVLLAPVFWACWALVSTSPACVQRLPGQFQSCKSANNVWTRYAFIFSGLEFSLHSAPWIEGFEKERVRTNVLLVTHCQDLLWVWLRHQTFPLLTRSHFSTGGGAVLSSESVPFPSQSFLSLKILYECHVLSVPRLSKKPLVASSGSAGVVVPCLRRHLNFWLPSRAFLQMAGTQLQST